MARGTESYSGLAGNTFRIPGFENVSPGMGQTIRLGKRNTLCCKSKWKLFLFGFIFFLFAFYYILSVKFLQNHHVMVTYLGLCC